MMAFDIESLLTFSESAIRRFAADHQGELFYAFAIDANLLCLNSEEAAARTLEEYRETWLRQTRPVDRWEDLTEEDLKEADFTLSLHETHSGLDRSDRRACLAVINKSRARARQKGDRYLEADEIRALRENTGDWGYQGFAELTVEVGFDSEAYSDHYDMTEAEQGVSAYGRAMDELVHRLEMADAFAVLKTTPDFKAGRVEHNY